MKKMTSHKRFIEMKTTLIL